MSDSSFHKKLKIPWYVWLIDCLGLLFFGAICGVFAFSFYQNHQTKPVTVIALAGIVVLCLVPLAFLVGIIRELVGNMKVNGIVVQDNGLQKATRGKTTVWKWEDVTWFEKPTKGSFRLIFKNGESICIPVQVGEINELENYCLQKLERIGTFKDLRKEPRILSSIPFWKTR